MSKTSVTAVVKDPSGNIYANATVIASFVGQNTTPGSGPYLDGGLPQGLFQLIVPTETDSAGNLALTLTDNNTITPTPSQWNFTVLSDTTPMVAFSVLITITGTTQNISAALQAAAASLITNPTSISPSSIDNRIWVDGTKYPLTRTGIQAAINDACATVGGLGNGTWLYLPPLTLSLTAADVPGATEVFLVPCSLQIEGAGMYQTVFSSTGIASTIPWFRLKPSSAASAQTARFSHFQITGGGGGSAGDGIVLDATTASPGSTTIEHVFITGLSSGAFSVSTTIPAGASDIGKITVQHNKLNAGTSWTSNGAGGAGDSILLFHNEFTGQTATACADVSLQAGSAEFTMLANNGSCDGGILVAHRGAQFRILHNQFEQTLASTEANASMIDLIGDVASIDGSIIEGNNLNAHTFATNNIRLGNATNTLINGNVITVKAVTGVGILLTSPGATGTVIPFNEYVGTGGGAVSISNPGGVTNYAVRGPDGLKTSPTFSWDSSPQSGLFAAGANVPTISVAGVDHISWANGVSTVGSGQGFGWSSNVDPPAAGPDTVISRPAANVFAFGNAIGNVTGETRMGKVTVGGDTSFTKAPRATFGAFIQATGQAGGFFTPDVAITVTRVQATAQTQANCTVAPTITSFAGAISLSIPNATGNIDSGAISVAIPAGTNLSFTLNAGTCTTQPANVNVEMQYKLQ